jgi:hypothetical protein
MSIIRSALLAIIAVAVVGAAETAGVIKAVTEATVVLTVGEAEQTFQVDANTTVTVDGAAATLAELKAGQNATVTHAEGATAATAVAATAPAAP